MARKLKSDKVLFLATLLLALASIVMVYSASAAIAEERFHSPYLFLIKQSIWVGNVTSYVVENMSKDFFFGVRAVDTEGTRSPVVFPRP